jgi:hypothetical protein
MEPRIGWLPPSLNPPATFSGWLRLSLPHAPAPGITEGYRPLGGGQSPTHWPLHFLSPTSQRQPGRRWQEGQQGWSRQ